MGRYGMEDWRGRSPRLGRGRSRPGESEDKINDWVTDFPEFSVRQPLTAGRQSYTHQKHIIINISSAHAPCHDAQTPASFAFPP